MKLMTQEILKKIPPLYSTDGQGSLDDRICYVKFFNPVGSWTWYAIEYDPESRIFFGWVDGDFPEWGNFSMDEFESVAGKLPLGLSIERDMYFTPKPMKEIKNYQQRGM